MPFDNCYLAICHASLGNMEKAREHAKAMIASRPDSSVQTWLPKEPFRDPADLEHFVAGMRKAGFPEQPATKPVLAVINGGR
jgi:adenylate cyclase